MNGIISESTRTTLGFLVVTIGLLGAVFAFVLNIASRVTAMETNQRNHESTDDKRVELLMTKSDRCFDFMQRVDSRVSRLEGRIERK